MRVSVTDAKAQLTDLVRRAERAMNYPHSPWSCGRPACACAGATERPSDADLLDTLYVLKARTAKGGPIAAPAKIFI